jgi:hypothetical protein
MPATHAPFHAVDAPRPPLLSTPAPCRHLPPRSVPPPVPSRPPTRFFPPPKLARPHHSSPRQPSFLRCPFLFALRSSLLRCPYLFVLPASRRSFLTRHSPDVRHAQGCHSPKSPPRIRTSPSPPSSLTATHKKHAQPVRHIFPSFTFYSHHIPIFRFIIDISVTLDTHLAHFGDF